MEYENHYASNAKANTGVTLGAVALGTALLGGGVGNNILGGILGGRCAESDRPISRFEAEQAATISRLESSISLRDANTYTDSKLLSLYENINGRLNGIEAQICQQNVVNAQITANIACMQNTIATLSGLTKTVIPIDSICPTPAVATTTGA